MLKNEQLKDPDKKQALVLLIVAAGILVILQVAIEILKGLQCQ